MKWVDNINNWKHDIVKNTKYYLMVPAVIVVFALIMWCVQGLNVGIDFTGGTAVSAKFGSELMQESTYNTRVNEVKEVMSEFGLTMATNQRIGENESAKLQVRYQNLSGKSNEEMQEISEQFIAALQAKYTTIEVDNATTISASASASLLLNALLAVCIAVVLIMVYLALRFKQWSFGLCSIISMVHDVLIMLAFMMIFHLEVSSTFVAALITIVGYSINNNVVIFDRIRENKKLMQKDTIDSIANASIKQTLTRTIVTTLTTFIVVFCLLFVGIPGITSFVLPITIGLVASFYSSVFVASPLWAKFNDMMNKNSDTKKKNKEYKEIVAPSSND